MGVLPKAETTEHLAGLSEVAIGVVEVLSIGVEVEDRVPLYRSHKRQRLILCHLQVSTPRIVSQSRSARAGQSREKVVYKLGFILGIRNDDSRAGSVEEGAV